jgi:UDP-GlcNAc:undecaprenyl-phosphate/decaprenyl-phosphate GlcNAc-1-phosphate transferase
MSFAFMQLLYSFTIAMLLTAVLMPVIIRYAPAFGLIDHPDANRKVHTRVIPRCGGLAMALGVAAPLLWYLPSTTPLPHLLLACIVIVLFGALDDRNSLDYRWKFLGQILAALIVMRGGILIHRVPMLEFDNAPLWLSYFLTFFFILGITNAVNLTDGLDGLAAGTTLLALAILFALAQFSDNNNAAFIALTVTGGILGFLRYNTFPARVFMGDAGSQFLGFITVCLSILVTQAETCAVSPALPLLILGLPMLDTVMVMTIRLGQGRSPFAPDRNHLHHQIMALGFYHNEAVAIIYVLQIALLALAFALRFAQDGLLLCVYLIFAGSLILLLAVARQHGWRVRLDSARQGFIDRRNFVLRKLQWFYHRSEQIVQTIVALLLIFPAAFPRSGGLGISSIAVILPAILLTAASTYARFPVWSTRLSIYSASVLSVYLLSVNPLLQGWGRWINGTFIALAIILALAIRMTRREQFRLDTQDLLILVMIMIVPLLPFDSINRYAIGEFSLRLAVLMYSCEFIVGKSTGKTLLPVNGAAMLSMLLAIVWHFII